MQNCRGQHFKGVYRRNYRNNNFERGRSRSKNRKYSDYFRRNDRSSSSSSRSGSRAITYEDRIRCYRHREYDHFTNNCPTSQVEKESEQIQQMYNMDEEQTALKVLATDTYESLNKINSADKNCCRPFKLVESKNGPTTFLPLNTKIGGPARYIKVKAAICLMNDHEIITNKVEKKDIIASQMEQRSILSNVANYVQYDRYLRNFMI